MEEVLIGERFDIRGNCLVGIIAIMSLKIETIKAKIVYEIYFYISSEISYEVIYKSGLILSG